MLKRTKLNQKKIWKIVEKTRIAFLSEHHTDLSCDSNSILLSDKKILKNINSLAAELKLNTTFIPNKNASNETLQIAAEMFTYLNYCPTAFDKIFSFSKYLFETGTPKEIIFALMTLMKTSQNAAKTGTIEIFSKVMETLSLSHYKDIQIITKGKCYSKATFGNCAKKINVTNKEKLEILGFLH